MSAVCSGVHRMACRLLHCRRTFFSSNVNLREMLSWYRPPPHKCWHSSCRCFSQPLLSQDNTSEAGGNRRTSVSKPRPSENQSLTVNQVTEGTRSKAVAPVIHLDFAVVGHVPHPEHPLLLLLLLPAPVLPLCFHVWPSCRSRDKPAQNS